MQIDGSDRSAPAQNSSLHACQVLSEIGIATQQQSTMYKAVLALAASAGAFAPNVHQRATVVQQGVPLANGAMEFDRTAPASA